MKKIFSVAYVLLSINVYGADKAKCEELFKSAIYNFYLENSCKFDKRLSSTMRKKFKDQGCEELFSDADMKNLNSEVLGSSYQAMKKVGKDAFCEESRDGYEKGYREQN